MHNLLAIHSRGTLKIVEHVQHTSEHTKSTVSTGLEKHLFPNAYSRPEPGTSYLILRHLFLLFAVFSSMHQGMTPYMPDLHPLSTDNLYRNTERHLDTDFG